MYAEIIIKNGEVYGSIIDWLTPKQFADCIQMRMEGELSNVGLKTLIREVAGLNMATSLKNHYENTK